MIRRYPAGDFDRDHRIAPRRDGPEKIGLFGSIVYVYRLALESQFQSNLKPRNQGRLYHPVNTKEEADYWLDFYRKKTTIVGYEKRPLYEKVWFIPNVENS